MFHFDRDFVDKNGERYMLPVRMQALLRDLMNQYVIRKEYGTGDFEFLLGDLPYSELTGSLAWTPFAAGKMLWGEPDQWAWFRQRITVPEEFEGETLWYAVFPYTTDADWHWGHPQAQLYVNGECVFGLDSNHRKYLLRKRAKGGETIEIAIKVYSDLTYFAGKMTMAARLQVLRPQVYELYQSLIVPLKAAALMDSDSLARVQLVARLNEAMSLLEIGQAPDSQAFLDSVEAAQRFLRENLYGTMRTGSEPVLWSIGHSHIDVAWQWTYHVSRNKAARTFGTNLRLLEENPEYLFMASQPVLYEYVKEDQPALYEQVRRRVAEGRWEPEGGMYVEADTNLTGGESLVRQFLFGKRFFAEEFGVDSRVLWLPDVFGYSGNLPQICRKSGIDYFYTTKIGWNEYNKFPYDTFRWRGLDGSTILTHFGCAISYAEVETDFMTTYNPSMEPSFVLGAWKRYQQKDINRDLLYDFGYGDGGGGPASDYLEYAKREKDLEGCPKVKLEGPIEFFQDMEAEGGPKHTYTGELYFSAHRGTYTSQAMVKNNNRRCELSMRDLELWGTLAAQKGQTYPAEAIERLWKEVLLHQFHDILPGSSIARVYEDAEKAFHAILEESHELTAKAVAGLVEAGNGVTVGNSLGFAYDTLVELPESFAAGAQTREGKAVPTEKIGDKVYGLTEVPAYGMVSLVPAETQTKAADSVSLTQDGDTFILENNQVKAVVDGKGEVVSFVLKTSGREFAAEPMNRFHLYKDVPRLFDAWDIDSNYIDQEITAAEDVTVTVESAGSLRSVLKVTGRISNSPFVQYIRLDADSTRLEFETAIDWKELHRLLKVGFPVNVFTENGINEMQFGYVERPTRRSRAYEKDRFEVCNHRYSALCDQAHGAAVLNDCKYGISMNGNALELTLLRAAAAPEMHADNREHHFTYGFTAWEGSFADSDVVRQGYEMNVKPVITAGVVDTFSAFGVEKDNVILESVKLAEDGSGDLILRLYEAKKAAVNTKVFTALNVAQAWTCDMLEKKEAEVAVEDNTVSLDFRAFEIKTLRLKLA